PGRETPSRSCRNIVSSKTSRTFTGDSRSHSVNARLCAGVSSPAPSSAIHSEAVVGRAISFFPVFIGCNLVTPRVAHFGLSASDSALDDAAADAQPRSNFVIGEIFLGLKRERGAHQRRHRSQRVSDAPAACRGLKYLLRVTFCRLLRKIVVPLQLLCL